jgi:hypothetical protein
MSETSTNPQPSEPRPLPPLDEEMIDNWRWIVEEGAKGRFYEYDGKYVAIMNKTIYGSGRDPELLEKYVVEKYGLDPKRLIIYQPT